jgi:phosphoribosylanthranilate isomerase
MSTVRVKICGVTREADAELCVRLGADAVGLNFWSGSPRRCDVETARRIVRALPPFVTPVGVFVNPDPAEVARVVDHTGIAVVQLHGDEGPDLCARMPRPVLKAIRVRGLESLRAADAYRGLSLLLDTFSTGYGGSGRPFAWNLLRDAPLTSPFTLAGGLTPSNVTEAIRAARPYAVDVASGVESAPGVKDPHKLSRFIQTAKES